MWITREMRARKLWNEFVPSVVCLVLSWGPGRGVTNWMSERNLVSPEMPRAAWAAEGRALAIIDQSLSSARTSQSRCKKSPSIKGALSSEIWMKITGIVKHCILSLAMFTPASSMLLSWHWSFCCCLGRGWEPDGHRTRAEKCKRYLTTKLPNQSPISM